MNEQEDIKIFPLLIGFIALFFIFWIFLSMIPPQNVIYVYLILGLIAVFISFIIYQCVKNPDFKIKTFNILKNIGIYITKFGLAVIKKAKEEKNKSKKKKRIPIPESIKKQVYERANNSCQYCGDSNVKLHIHHINKNPSDNRMNNLIVLCPNHHSTAESLNVVALKNRAKKSFKKEVIINKYYNK